MPRLSAFVAMGLVVLSAWLQFAQAGTPAFAVVNGRNQFVMRCAYDPSDQSCRLPQLSASGNWDACMRFYLGDEQGPNPRTIPLLYYGEFYGNSLKTFLNGGSSASGFTTGFSVRLGRLTGGAYLLQISYPSFDLNVPNIPFSDTPVGAWHTICMQVQSGSVTFEVDGVSVGTTNAPPSSYFTSAGSANPRQLVLGAAVSSTGSFIFGGSTTAIDDFRLFTTHSATSFSDYYNNGCDTPSPDDSGIESWVSFDRIAEGLPSITPWSASYEYPIFIDTLSTSSSNVLYHRGGVRNANDNAGLAYAGVQAGRCYSKSTESAGIGVAEGYYGAYVIPAGDSGPTSVPGATGPAGDTGPVGPAGSAGAVGPAGATGPASAKGDKGAQGPAGPAGDTGAAGVKGAKGAKGPAGVTGPKGAPGAASTGPLGSVGPAGLNGDQGDVGVAGAAGNVGVVGSVGPKGAQGFQGPTGAAGDTGAKGVKGVQGVAGDAGVQGSQGPAGSTGPQGDAGAAGAVGVTGPQGTAGAVGAKGQVGPKGGPGDAGDAGAAGANGGPGDTGAKGVQGAQGSVGPQGAEGIKGVKGLAGATGPAGDAGDAGVVGNVGPKGDTGPTGPKGAQGAPGPIGDKGPVGDAGVAGSVGPQGSQGPQGAKGTVGVTGAAGATGPVGLAGFAGPAGDTGPKGNKGLLGPVGSVGGAGDAGDAGVVGSAGPQGAVGLTGNPGAVGDAGDTGPAGSVGAAGAAGVNGDVGAQGITGPAGANGVQGPAGKTGSKGMQGPAGLRGAAGPAGDVGLDGPAGATGPAGPKGDKGEPGIAPGSTAPAGDKGVKGVKGSVGPVGQAGGAGAGGDTGPVGSRGPSGVAGDSFGQGPVGSAGPKGAVGEKGSAGPGGDTGASGSIGVVGSVGPVGFQGAVGPAGPIGDKGAIGAAGPKGDIGIKGVPGAVGPTGAAGAAGVRGAQGPVGPVGVAGPQGAQGPKGDAGTKGPQGPAGAPGPQGAAGPVGDAGAPGATGAAGRKGAAGRAGVAGATGPLGDAGDTGPQGSTNLGGLKCPVDTSLKGFDAQGGLLCEKCPCGTATGAGVCSSDIPANGNFQKCKLTRWQKYGYASIVQAVSDSDVDDEDDFGSSSSSNQATCAARVFPKSALTQVVPPSRFDVNRQYSISACIHAAGLCRARVVNLKTGVTLSKLEVGREPTSNAGSCSCAGGVSSVTLMYTGYWRTAVWITQQDGRFTSPGSFWNVKYGDQLTVSSSSPMTSIKVYSLWDDDVTFRLGSCTSANPTPALPITSGSFQVVSGLNVNKQPLCIGTSSSGSSGSSSSSSNCNKCRNGKLKRLVVSYNGEKARHVQATCNGESLFSGVVTPGTAISLQRSSGTFSAPIVLSSHFQAAAAFDPSCATSIAAGLTNGDFVVTSAKDDQDKEQCDDDDRSDNGLVPTLTCDQAAGSFWPTGTPIVLVLEAGSRSTCTFDNVCLSSIGSTDSTTLRFELGQSTGLTDQESSPSGGSGGSSVDASAVGGIVAVVAAASILVVAATVYVVRRRRREAAKDALADRLADKITGTDSAVAPSVVASAPPAPAAAPPASNIRHTGMTLSGVPHALGDVERFYDEMDLPSMDGQA